MLSLLKSTIIPRSYPSQSSHSAVLAARKSTMAQQPRYMNEDVCFCHQKIQSQSLKMSLTQGTCGAHEERQNAQQGFPGRRCSRRWLRRRKYQGLPKRTIKRFLNECGWFGKTDAGSSNSYLPLRSVASPVSIYIHVHQPKLSGKWLSKWTQDCKGTFRGVHIHLYALIYFLDLRRDTT